MGLRLKYARRTDSNHQELIAAFRKFGCWVSDTHDLGNGFPDALIAIPPSWNLALIEFKDGKKPPSQRKLTEQEEEFHAKCPANIWIVESLDDVQTVIRHYRRV